MDLSPSRRWLVALVAAVALLAVSCGVEVGRSALVAAGTTAPSSGTSNGGAVVGGEAVTTTTTTVTTTTSGARRPGIEIDGDDGSPANVTVANAITDLQDWWGTEFPRLYQGKAYRPVAGGFFAIDRNTNLSDLACAPDNAAQVLGNAYYCPPSDAVVWDQEQLMPELVADFGDLAPAVVIAHEWGHAIQARSGFEEPTIIFELQADCFAGAWVRHVRDDGDGRFPVTTDDLDRALAGFLSLRDAPGSTADDPNAHGSGFDRVRAFQEGFEDGLDRCAQYRNGDPKPFQFPFSNESEIDSGGDLPLHTDTEDGILDLIPGSLDNYWTATFPTLSGGTPWDPLGPLRSFTTGDPPDCGGQPVSDFDLFVCVPDRYIGYVEDPTLADVYDQTGDFAVATLIATKYGVDAESQLGDLPNDATTGLRGDCYAGSWAASILPDRATDQGDQTVTLSPGDLDEAVSVLLSVRTQGERESEGPGFDRVRAFRIGVLDGAEACTDVQPS